MLGLIYLQVSNSISNINKTNKKFELYTDIFDEFSFTELKYEHEEILSISDSTPYHLQHEKIGPRIIEAYRKLRLEKPSNDAYIILILGFSRLPLRDFESYLRRFGWRW